MVTQNKVHISKMKTEKSQLEKIKTEIEANKVVKNGNLTAIGLNPNPAPNPNSSVGHSFPETVQIDLDQMNSSSSRPPNSVTKNAEKFKNNTKAESIDEEYDDDDFDWKQVK